MSFSVIALRDDNELIVIQTYLFVIGDKSSYVNVTLKLETLIIL